MRDSPETLLINTIMADTATNNFIIYYQTTTINTPQCNWILPHFLCNCNLQIILNRTYLVVASLMVFGCLLRCMLVCIFNLWSLVAFSLVLCRRLFTLHSILQPVIAHYGKDHDVRNQHQHYKQRQRSFRQCHTPREDSNLRCRKCSWIINQSSITISRFHPSSNAHKKRCR